MNTGFLGPAVATVLTVYGIETQYHHRYLFEPYKEVATVLTVYGIETAPFVCTMVVAYYNGCNSTYRLRY